MRPLLLIGALVSCAPSLSAGHGELAQARLNMEAYAATQGDYAPTARTIGLAKLGVVAASLRESPGDVQSAQIAQLRYLLECDPAPEMGSPDWAERLSAQLEVSARLQSIATATPTLRQAQAQAQAWLESGAGTPDPQVRELGTCAALKDYIHGQALRW